MMKNDEKNRNIIFYFPFSQNAKKKSFDKLAQKKKKKNTNTNNPKREEEQEAFVRSFVRHGRRRHPNEEEHLVETETTRWRGRRVRFVREVKCTRTRTIHFFFRRHFPRLSFFPPRWKERSRVRES